MLEPPISAKAPASSGEAGPGVTLFMFPCEAAEEGVTVRIDGIWDDGIHTFGHGSSIVGVLAIGIMIVKLG